LRFLTIADKLKLKITKIKPIGDGLNAFYNSFKSIYKGLAILGPNALYLINREDIIYLLIYKIPNINRIEKLPL